MAHQFGAAAEGAHRHAAADDLGQRRQVGLDAGEALHALRADAKAGHDLVEDQHAAVAGTQLAQAFEEAGCRLDEVHVAGDRFDDHAGDVGAMLAKAVCTAGRLL